MATNPEPTNTYHADRPMGMAPAVIVCGNRFHWTEPEDAFAGAPLTTERMPEPADFGLTWGEPF